MDKPTQILLRGLPVWALDELLIAHSILDSKISKQRKFRARQGVVLRAAEYMAPPVRHMRGRWTK